jgi:hypothetical protein
MGGAGHEIPVTHVPFVHGLSAVHGMSSLKPPLATLCSQTKASLQSSPVLHEVPSGQELPQSCVQAPPLIVESTLPSGHAVTALKAQYSPLAHSLSKVQDGAGVTAELQAKPALVRIPRPIESRHVDSRFDLLIDLWGNSIPHRPRRRRSRPGD